MRSYNRQLADYLSADATLLGALVGDPPNPGEQDARSWSGLAAGGVYTRPPKPWVPDDSGKIRGATPVAFSATSGLIKPCIAVMQESSIRHAQAERITKAQIVSVACWFYGPAHDSGKTAMEAMRVRVDDLLDGLIFQTDQGPMAQIQWDFALGVQENGREYAGSVVDMARYFITTLRGVEV